MTANRLMSARLALILASVFLLIAVAAGAFGAHALKARIAPELLSAYQTGVQYHFWHALGLLAIGVLLTQKPDSGALAVAAWLLVAGMLLFSGSLYALALSGVRSFGAVAPIGGVALLAAWSAMAWAAWRW
jgi:uncharacterized membrane protein YgdD (TMEM256/DUF423 family)